MAKTKIIIKENQVLVDAELIFEQIREAGGQWEKVEQEIKAMLEAFKDK